jgi:hypothetical protein
MKGNDVKEATPDSSHLLSQTISFCVSFPTLNVYCEKTIKNIQMIFIFYESYRSKEYIIRLSRLFKSFQSHEMEGFSIFWKLKIAQNA